METFDNDLNDEAAESEVFDTDSSDDVQVEEEVIRNLDEDIKGA